MAVLCVHVLQHVCVCVSYHVGEWVGSVCCVRALYVHVCVSGKCVCVCVRVCEHV